MKRIVFLFALLSYQIALSQKDALFEQGNAAYQAGDYALAIELYDSIQNSGAENAELYYNLGNAHYQNGALALAILNYERALRLKPADEEIAHNLALAQSKRVDRLEEMPLNLFKAFRLSVLKLFSPDKWAGIGIAFLLFAALGLGLYLFSAWGRIGFVALIAGSFLGVFSIIMAYSHHHYKAEHPELIIMSDSAYVKSGPSNEAEDLFILHAGTKALQVEEFEAWTKIRLKDGKIGWLPSAQTEAIP